MSLKKCQNKHKKKGDIFTKVSLCNADKLVKMEVRSMRQTKTKQHIDVDIEVIDGNQLVGKVLEDKDPQVEQCVDTINDLPDSHDIDRVMKIKQQVDAGEYDFDAKLGKVVDALIDESMDENTIAYPLFDR
ncbi:hypothetical protein DID73_01440 [Candidatus Marinamargulisbacteria bacterium SCGC AG-343-K17]|nr:hypothetical protein DID73_01440 [Candidatus Marinamargulisbacteria bacterium SCGC AG-343-K17]